MRWGITNECLAGRAPEPDGCSPWPCRGRRGSTKRSVAESVTGQHANPVVPVILCVVKIAVSVPDTLHERAEEFAARLGLKRSQLYARAVEEFLSAHDEDAVTAALDALAGEASSSGAEGSGRAVGKAMIDSGDWVW